MAKGTVMVRVTEETRARLQAEAARLVRLAEGKGRAGVQVSAETINPRACGVSLDQVIVMLLDADQAHRERARLAGARQRAAAAARKIRCEGGESQGG